MKTDRVCTVGRMLMKILRKCHIDHRPPCIHRQCARKRTLNRTLIKILMRWNWPATKNEFCWVMFSGKILSCANIKPWVCHEFCSKIFGYQMIWNVCHLFFKDFVRAREIIHGHKFWVPANMLAWLKRAFYDIYYIDQVASTLDKIFTLLLFFPGKKLSPFHAILLQKSPY